MTTLRGPPLHGCCPRIVANCRFSHVLRPMWWQTWTSHCCTSGFLLPDTQSDQPLSCHVEGNGSLVFDAGIMSDLILNRILPLPPFLPCGTLQGVSIVSVKHQNDLIIVRDIRLVLEHSLRYLSLNDCFLSATIRAPYRPPVQFSDLGHHQCV